MRKGIGIVDMEYGRVAGEEQNSITLFRGIPYAKPPVGELRWKARGNAAGLGICAFKIPDGWGWTPSNTIPRVRTACI